MRGTIRKAAALILSLILMMPAASGLAADESGGSSGSDSLFKIEGSRLVEYLGKGKHSRVTVPKNVKVIGKKAFQGDEKLKTVILPDSVREIEEKAFADCTNLKEVRVTSKSKLKTIGKQAFGNCKKLNRDFAASVKTVAKDAFKIEEKKSDGNKKEETPEPEPEPEPEPVQPSAPSGGGSGKRTPHSRSQVETKHGYDQVFIPVPESGEEVPMQTLTLDEEELELTLENEAGEARSFTYALGVWGTPDQVSENSGGGDTLILQPCISDAETSPEDGLFRWKMNGAVLRKLNRSGIRYLVFRNGDQQSAVPTEGFLAGWAYDQLKSRGTAGRRFEYTLTMGDDLDSPRWKVSVEGTEYELEQDPLAAMYMINVLSGTGGTL